jgi:hypothetical protein
MLQRGICLYLDRPQICLEIRPRDKPDRALSQNITSAARHFGSEKLAENPTGDPGPRGEAVADPEEALRGTKQPQKLLSVRGSIENRFLF